MIQEIITYIIIATALYFFILKAKKKLGRKKRRPAAKADYKSATFSGQHNCADCSAECMLRDVAKPLNENNKELCKKIEIR
ncbi:MAG: hypothetical protein R2757_06650 [Draconibacterium sp.]